MAKEAGNILAIIFKTWAQPVTDVLFSWCARHIHSGINSRTVLYCIASSHGFQTMGFEVHLFMLERYENVIICRRVRKAIEELLYV